MSGENRELYHQDHHFLRDRGDLPFHDDHLPFYSQRPGKGALQELQGFHLQAASPYISFTDYLSGSSDYGLLNKAFDTSCSSPELFGPRDGGLVKRELVVDANIGANLNVSTGGGDGSTTPLTPNSSFSSSSAEAAGEEDSGRCKKDQQKVVEEQKQQVKGSEEGGDKSKKV